MKRKGIFETIEMYLRAFLKLTKLITKILLVTYQQLQEFLFSYNFYILDGIIVIWMDPKRKLLSLL